MSADDERHNPASDRNFDDVVEQFEHKISDAPKGRLRQAVLHRHLAEWLPAIDGDRPMDILDAGCGPGQSGRWLARKGHRVVFNDLSTQMLERCRERLARDCPDCRAEFLPGPVQELPARWSEGFDLVCFHAVLEWLADPRAGLRAAGELIRPGGHLSLSFYNRDALMFRNLIRGNWRKVESGRFAGHPGGLTPAHPLDLDTVGEWLRQQGLEPLGIAGLRVFHDYLPPEVRDDRPLDELIRIEWKYARHPAWMRLGRYLHLIAKKTARSV